MYHISDANHDISLNVLFQNLYNFFSCVQCESEIYKNS